MKERTLSRQRCLQNGCALLHRSDIAKFMPPVLASICQVLHRLHRQLSLILSGNVSDATKSTSLPGAPCNRWQTLLVYRARTSNHATGVAFETSRRGYCGEIRAPLGFDANGKLMGGHVLKHTGTPGLSTSFTQSCRGHIMKVSVTSALPDRQVGWKWKFRNKPPCARPLKRAALSGLFPGWT